MQARAQMRGWKLRQLVQKLDLRSCLEREFPYQLKGEGKERYLMS